MEKVNKIHILSFGYGRNLFNQKNSEHNRMKQCAQFVSSLDMVIFTKASDGLQSYTIGNLTFHPTHSKTKLLYFFDAIRIGYTILRDTKKKWVITTQDPFETGCIGLLLAWYYKQPLNVQEHGDFYSRPYWKQDRMSNWFRYYIGKFVLRNADTIRVVSERITTAIQKFGVQKERIYYLPVRTDVLDTEAENGPNLKHLYPDASIIILTMARLVTQKNLPMLINAFAHVVATEPKAKLVIVGTGPLEHALRHDVDRNGITSHVSFLPWTDTPQSYMQSADIYALSSDWEGWGRVLIEAMHAGVSVVTTDVGCVGTVFKDNIHGLVVQPRDQQAYTNALQKMVENQGMRETYQAHAKRDCCLHHVTMESYAEAWANIFAHTEKQAV